MKKLLVLLISILVITSIAYGASKSYEDLTSSHWAYEAVNKMTEDGILTGYPDGTFLPNKLLVII